MIRMFLGDYCIKLNDEFTSLYFVRCIGDTNMMETNETDLKVASQSPDLFHTYMYLA